MATGCLIGLGIIRYRRATFTIALMWQTSDDRASNRTDPTAAGRAARPGGPTAARAHRVDALLLAVLVAGAALRIWHLDGQSLWYDEWLSAQAVSGGVEHVLHHVANREGIAPTYFLILWGWVRLFGDGAGAMRALSVLIGTATIPLAYAIALELRQRRAAARIAALLVAVNPMLVWYSQEARPYSLVAFLGALSLCAFSRVRNSGRPKDLYWWGLICAGALAVHYFAAFIVLAEGIALLASRRFHWRQLLLSCVPGVVVVVGLLPIALHQYSNAPNHQWIAAFALRYRLGEAVRATVVGPGPPNTDLALVGGIVVAGIAVLIVGWGSRDERSAAGLCAAIAGGAVAISLLAVGLGIDVLLGRYLIASLVPLIVAVSVGLAVRRARWVGAAALAVLCAISLTTVESVARDPQVQKPDWHAVAQVFANGRSNRLLVLNRGGDIARPLLYYLNDVKLLGADEPAVVTEIDVLTAKPSKKFCNLLVGMACGFIFLGGPLPEPVSHQFRLRERHELDQFRIDRYIAPSPVVVRLPQLVAPQDVPGSLAIVTKAAV